MSLTKEVRIGLLVSIALVILFTGFYFLKGASIFSKEKEYYCIYPNVEGLQHSANVQIRGLNSGRVARMELVDGQGVKVVISLSKSIEIPEGTVASLAAFDLLGTKMIKLDLGKGPGLVKSGSQLPTAKEGGIIESVSGELTPMLQKLSATIVIFDSALAHVNEILGEQNQKAIAGAIQSLKTTSDNLAMLSGALNSETVQISGILRNANSITGNLVKENDSIRHMIDNFSILSRQLANAPIQKTFNELQGVSTQMNGIMGKINNNEGSLGMLVNNKDVYNNLNSSLQSLNNLMTDIKAHPKQYINVTIFGKKK
jgi:phospholipid/cholesterol/gamma-HCH transport system substrate-binding protein